MDAPTPPPSFSLGQRWNIVLNLLITVVAVTAFAAMANYLASRHFKRWNLSQQNATRLSPRTVSVLNNLSNTVRVTVLFNRDEAVFPRVQALLREYQNSSPKLEIETVDYILQPTAARLLKERYHLQRAADRDVVIFESAGRQKTVTAGDLSELDYREAMTGRTNVIERTHFNGELQFTAAIYAVGYGRTPKAYFVAGHGERLPDDTDQNLGWSKFSRLLQENNVEIARLNLRGGTEIPADANLLIIPGALDAFSDEEVTAVQKYLDQGGRLLVALNNLAAGRRTGLEDLLQRWNLQVGERVLVDLPNSRSGTGTEIVLEDFTPHPITTPLRQNSPVQMALPRAVQAVESRSARPEEPKAVELIFTGPATVQAEFVRGQLRYDPLRDRRGRTAVMAAVERGSIPGVSAARGSTRLVVVGDSYLWNNQMIDAAANRDLASFAINWLLDQSALLGEIPPQPIKKYRLTVTERQMTGLRWILLLGLPGSVLLLGFFVWFRRRS